MLMDTKKTLTVEELFGLPPKESFQFSHFEDYSKSIECIKHCKKINAWKWIGSENTVLI